MAASPEETLNGLIERVTFHNPETGFCVLKVKAKGHKDLIVVIGACAVVTAGEWIEAGGFWIQDRQYGQQFKALIFSCSGFFNFLANRQKTGFKTVYINGIGKIMQMK